MREHHLRVFRTARYFTIGPEPPAAPAELWFVLHGYRQLAARFLARFTAIADANRLIVAPEALSRFYLDEAGGTHGPEARIGATWMTREDRLAEIADYIDYLDALHEHLRERAGMSWRPRLHAVGFSQGAATASRWAVMGRTCLDRLVLWAGALPPDLDPEAARQRLPRLRLTFVTGDADPHLTADRIATALAQARALGGDPEHVHYAGGHRIEKPGLAALLHAGSASPSAVAGRGQGSPPA
ncbi:MAG: alpha/beta hydrolase [Longimicrobiales bacterium]